MLIQQQLPLKRDSSISSSNVKKAFLSDKTAMAFAALAMSYLATGLIFGVLGGFQYLLPDLLREKLAFEKTRPLHVYLAITWIFTMAQAAIYFFLPRVSGRKLFWQQGAWIHFSLQLITSLAIVAAFFGGYFGGREYLEFPPLLGFFIALSWIPFAVNFFGTLRPNFSRAPVYYFSWTAGIIFFFITLSESYLWIFDFFNNNQVRDTTIQWKALGSMVGAWNMLVYGTSFYMMEKIKGDPRISRNPIAFFFFFLGFTNLLFNWGHHTYIVPAADWVKTVAYVISMTELLILGHIIWNFRRTLSEAQKNYHSLPYRLLSFADFWIFLNLAAAIAISIPALNYYTHGTHITVAHAMGTTIGINTMLLFAAMYYMLQHHKPGILEQNRKLAGWGIIITNVSLVLFWFSLIGSGIVKISGQLDNQAFAAIMQDCLPFFKLFAFSGVFILLGLLMMIVAAFVSMRKKVKPELSDQENTELVTFSENTLQPIQ